MRRLAALSFLICAAVFAQPVATVLVTVDGPAGLLAGVTVTVVDGHGGRTAVVSGADGGARFRLRPGTYQVTATRDGFTTGRDVISVGSEGRPLSIRIAIRRAVSRQAARALPATRAPAAVASEAPRPLPDPAPMTTVTTSTTSVSPTATTTTTTAITTTKTETAPMTANAPRRRPAEPSDTEEEENYAVLRIYYATDRAFTGEAEPDKLFGPMRGRLSLGIARVSIPREHKLGELEGPSIINFQFRRDPEKHVVLLSVSPQRPDDFFAKLKTSVDNSEGGEAFVFIHGYNVTFEDATRRTAQIKYDLGFDGPAILYSWPSWGKTREYPADSKNAEWASRDLTTFLTDLAERSGATSIHLVAHSMGNLVLAGAMKELANQTLPPHFDQVVLAAPDLDADRFRREFAPAFMLLSKHLTLYASSRDEALEAGKTFDRSVRLGDSGNGIVELPAMDSIDVSDVDTSFLGHSYVADNRTVLSDVFCLIRGATRAAERCRLQAVGQHWKFVGALERLASLADYQCKSTTCLIR